MSGWAKSLDISHVFVINLGIKRHPDYAKRKAIIPICILVFITPVGHLLPAESGERIGFVITSILTMMLTQQYILDQMPQTSEEPRVLLYGRLVMVFMVVSLFLSAFVIRVYHKECKPMSRKAKILLSIVCRMLFIRYKHEDQVSDVNSKDQDEAKTDWMTLAYAIDRFCFIVFTTSGLTLFLLLSYFTSHLDDGHH